MNDDHKRYGHWTARHERTYICVLNLIGTKITMDFTLSLHRSGKRLFPSMELLPHSALFLITL